MGCLPLICVVISISFVATCFHWLYKRRPVCIFASEMKSCIFFLAFANLFVQKCEFSGVVGYNIRVLFIFRCSYVGFGVGVGRRHLRTVL